jgi:adenylyltransferase/sulfurtransferase
MIQNKSLADRYSRQTTLPEIGASGQQKLKRAKVLIVGMGGLGCPAAQYLTAAGVGTLGLMDHDLIQATNLHRQILYKESDVGQPKVTTAKTALQNLNSDVNINAINDWLTAENALSQFEEYDLIIDGSDNFQTKYLINDAAVLTGKPWVYGSIYKFQGQLSVFNYSNGPTYRCLFPTTTNRNVSCDEVGVIGALPGVLGILQASEAIKIILDTGNILSGKLKIIDLMTHQDQLIQLRRDDSKIEEIKNRGLKPEIFRCTLESGDKLYLDVRDKFEEPLLDESNVLKIPINRLEDHHSDIPTDRHVHVICQTGNRSKQAIKYLHSHHGFTNLVNVDGGIQAIMKQQETHA